MKQPTRDYSQKYTNKSCNSISKTTTKKPNNNKWAEDLNRHFYKEDTYRWPKST